MAKTYIFNRKTQLLKERKENVTRAPKKEESVWIDIHEKREDFLAIKDLFKLHPLTVDDCLKKETRLKIEVFDHYVLIIVYGVLIVKSEVRIQEVDFILGENFIITNHLNDIETITQLHNDKKTIQKLLNKGPDFILQYIMDRLIESYFSAIEKIDNEIDILEAKIFKKADPAMLTRLFKFKQHLMEIKRHTSNHREIVTSLAKRTVPFLSPRSSVYFRDLYDKVLRVSDFIDIQREMVSNIVETQTIVASNRMNEIIKVLTAIATIAMPLTVVSSIYGMNFRYMPELEWKFGYAFAWVLMLMSVVAMWIYFKKKAWL